MSGAAERLARARRLARQGEDGAATQAYLEVLRLAPDDYAALIELGALAYAGGHLTAARTAYLRAVERHPDQVKGWVNLATILAEDGDHAAARAHLEAALAIEPGFAPAHQGMARVLTALGQDAGPHWRAGFEGHPLVRQPFRGVGTAVRLLLLVSARGGNVPTRHWISDRRFDITVLHADFFDPAAPLPAHDLVVNAIGDADACEEALDAAVRLLAATTAPVINPPARVRLTGRAENARRLAAVPGVVSPAIRTVGVDAAAGEGLAYPVLLRVPGYHTGQHFVRVDSAEGFAAAAAAFGQELGARTLLAIEYLDARGADGMARKYRAMIVDGALYPLHLAISAQWKVHYFSAAMAGSAALREEERRFLEDMPGTIGVRAMAALAGIGAALGLDYAGVDFAVAADGSLLLFEANATMVVFPPDADPMWDYRRPAIGAVLAAIEAMLARRVSHNSWTAPGG